MQSMALQDKARIMVVVLLVYCATLLFTHGPPPSPVPRSFDPQPTSVHPPSEAHKAEDRAHEAEPPPAAQSFAALAPGTHPPPLLVRGSDALPPETLPPPPHPPVRGLDASTPETPPSSPPPPPPPLPLPTANHTTAVGERHGASTEVVTPSDLLALVSISPVGGPGPRSTRVSAIRWESPALGRVCENWSAGWCVCVGGH